MQCCVWAVLYSICQPVESIYKFNIKSNWRIQLLKQLSHITPSTPQRTFWPFHGELSLCNGLSLYGSHIVVPVKLCTRLSRIYHSHQGINQCLLSSAWRPGVSKAIEAYVKHCYPPSWETLIVISLPQWPWKREQLRLTTPVISW